MLSDGPEPCRFMEGSGRNQRDRRYAAFTGSDISRYVLVGTVYVADEDGMPQTQYVECESVSGEQLDVFRLVYTESEIRQIFYLARLAFAPLKQNAVAGIEFVGIDYRFVNEA